MAKHQPEKYEREVLVYMHASTKNNGYKIGAPAFRNQMTLARENERCACCGIAFLDFRKGE